MAAKVQLSASARAKQERIRRLPQFLGQELLAINKRDALGVIKAFHDGIGEDGLGLDRLANSTVASKIRKGYSRPETPLYAAGDDETNSYVNALGLRKLKNGYRVFVRKARHHESRLRLSDLFVVHEFGATINTGKALVVIPPRPAFAEAFAHYMRSRRREEPARMVKRAMTELIETGRSQTHRMIIRRQNEFMTRGLKEI